MLFSAVTPDLYRPMYGDKVVAFFDQLMAPQFASKPFMRHYLDYYFDIYWDLHLGVKGEAIPKQVRQIGEAFNATSPLYSRRCTSSDLLLGRLRDRIDHQRRASDFV